MKQINPRWMVIGIIVLALVAFNKLDDLWMGPLMKWTVFALSLILSPFEFLLNT